MCTAAAVSIQNSTHRVVLPSVTVARLLQAWTAVTRRSSSGSYCLASSSVVRSAYAATFLVSYLTTAETLISSPVAVDIRFASSFGALRWKRLSIGSSRKAFGSSDVVPLELHTALEQVVATESNMEQILTIIESWIITTSLCSTVVCRVPNCNAWLEETIIIIMTTTFVGTIINF